VAPKLQLVCFDLDGLLVDTEGYYFEAHRSVFAEYGVEITREEYARRWIIAGEKTEQVAPLKGIAADPKALSAEARRRFRAMVEREIRLMPGAMDAVVKAARRFPTALVTNTPRAEAELILERTGLGAHLAHRITRERYERQKPAPDCYLVACEAAGVEAAEAVALEDSPRGVAAAVAAGLRVIWVPNAFTNLGGAPPGIWRTVPSLADVDWDDWADLGARR
jgi:HAD superfamily hydrolase (TIGR01509 family)